jgi:4-hydroxy-3-methylbut-2-enyl diphosphate reductase
LREIGEEAGVPSYLIPDGSGLEDDWLRHAKAVGLTAGASAPEVLVDDVIASLGRFGPLEITALSGVEENVTFRLPVQLADVSPAKAEAR